MAHLANEGLAHSSIKTYLSAIRHFQISGGYPNPNLGDMPRLFLVMRGIKSQQATSVQIPPTNHAHNTAQLRRVWDKSADDGDHIMLWAASTTCFFGFMRAGEITVPSQEAYDPTAHLSFNDVAVDAHANPTVMEVRIKASKTDPFRMGVNLYIGRTNNDLCPIAAMMAYLAIRGGGRSALPLQERPTLDNASVSLQRSAKPCLPPVSTILSMRVIALGSALLRQPHNVAFQIPQYNYWADGRARPISFTSAPPARLWRIFRQFLVGQPWII